MTSRFRSLLDLLTTVAILSACIVLVVVNWSRIWPERPGPIVPAAPISLEGATLKGSSSARIVLIEWSDYQCPYCARVETEVLGTIEEMFIRTNRAQLAFRHKPIAKIHPLAAKAAEAALCAGLQDKFWEMHRALFEDAKKLAEPDLMRRAKAVGLNVPQFGACLSAGAMASRIREDAKMASEVGLSGTPAFLVGVRQPDGRVHATAVLTGARPLDEFVSTIEAAERGSDGNWAGLWLWTLSGGLAVLLVGFWLWRRQNRLRQSDPTASSPELPILSQKEERI